MPPAQVSKRSFSCRSHGCSGGRWASGAVAEKQSQPVVVIIAAAGLAGSGVRRYLRQVTWPPQRTRTRSRKHDAALRRELPRRRQWRCGHCCSELTSGWLRSSCVLVTQHLSLARLRESSSPAVRRTPVRALHNAAARVLHHTACVSCCH